MATKNVTSHSHTVPDNTPSGTSGPRTRAQRTHLNLSCFACPQLGHKIYMCPVFLAQNPTQRSELVKHHKRCYSCLGAPMLSQCTSKNVCNTCQRKHHSMLHFKRKSVQNPSHPLPVQAPPQQPPVSTSTNVLVANAAHPNTTHSQPQATTVLLGTALVQVTASNGHSQVLRCLIDSGSQLSFITESAIHLLSAPRTSSTHEITGISATTSRTNLSTLGGQLIAAWHPIHILDRISADLPKVQISPEV